MKKKSGFASLSTVVFILFFSTLVTLTSIYSRHGQQSSELEHEKIQLHYAAVSALIWAKKMTVLQQCPSNAAFQNDKALPGLERYSLVVSCQLNSINEGAATVNVFNLQVIACNSLPCTETPLPGQNREVLTARVWSNS